tara:strand:+ start:836 stop:1006 length:171 start_codon:yes stop_codon:yes gene_type:complete
MKNIITVVNENKILKKNVKELQGQLQMAYKKIYELTERLNRYKVRESTQSEEKHYD